MRRRRLLTNGLAVLGGVPLAQTASITADEGGLIDNEDSETQTSNGLTRLRFSVRNSHDQTAILDEVTIDLVVDSREVAVVEGDENAIDKSIELRPENDEGSTGYYRGPIRSNESASLREDGQQATVEPGDDLIGDIGYFWDASGDIISHSSPRFFGTIDLAYQLPDSDEPGLKETTVRLANLASQKPEAEASPSEETGRSIQLHDEDDDDDDGFGGIEFY